MIWWRWQLAVAGAAALLVSPVAAQDTVPEPVRAERLRQLIEDRFAERLALELGLTDEQTGRVQGILANWAARRRTLEREERRLRMTLMSQMRPGVAADEAVVTRTLDAMLEGRAAYVQTFRDELRDLSAVLSPIQRAQYLLLRDRLAQRVDDIRRERPGPPPARRFPWRN